MNTTRSTLVLFLTSTCTLLRNPANRYSLGSFNFFLPECTSHVRFTQDLIHTSWFLPLIAQGVTPVTGPYRLIGIDEVSLRLRHVPSQPSAHLNDLIWTDIGLVTIRYSRWEHAYLYCVRQTLNIPTSNTSILYSSSE